LARCLSGHEVLAGDRFCGRCGWAVPVHCAYGHAAQPDHAFCRECGAAVDHNAGLPVVTWSPPASLEADVGVAPAAVPRAAWSSGARTAALVAGLLVLGAVGLGSYAGATGGRGDGNAVSSEPGAIVPSAVRRAAVPSFARGPNTVSSTSIPSATATPPTTQPASTVPPSTLPQASALPVLGPLTGDWSGHGGAVHIGADGQGQATFRAYRFCSDDPTPPCDAMMGNTIVDGGHAQFRLMASGAPGRVTGRVTSSNDPGAFLPGFAMTVSLTPGDVILVSASPTAQSVAYCGSRATPGACGA
jgi:hypothetical protein